MGFVLNLCLQDILESCVFVVADGVGGTDGQGRN